jgi:hypothetical protein
MTKVVLFPFAVIGLILAGSLGGMILWEVLKMVP